MNLIADLVSRHVIGDVFFVTADDVDMTLDAFNEFALEAHSDGDGPNYTVQIHEREPSGQRRVVSLRCQRTG